MTELLVWSLLGGGGLRDALNNALQTHSDDTYNHLQLDECVFYYYHFLISGKTALDGRLTDNVPHQADYCRLIYRPMQGHFYNTI